MDKIQGGHEIFYLHSHIVITIWKIIEITIPKELIKQIREMATHDKVKFLKLKNRAGVIYDNDWIAGMEYEDTEDEKEDYSKEDQEDKYYKEI